MILRACVKCGKPTARSYCPDHQPKPWESSTRSEKVKLSGSAQQARRVRVIDKYLGCCHVCGKVFAPADLEVDHRIPLSEGGEDTEANCAPICKPCHRSKTAAEAARAKALGQAVVRRRYK